MRYLFSYRCDKPQERRGERREQLTLDTERTADSSRHHSLDQWSHGDQGCWSLKSFKNKVVSIHLTLISQKCLNEKFCVYVDVSVVVIS